MNTYIFLLTSMALFLMQLFAYLVVMWIIILVIGYPIKKLIKSILFLIKRT